MGRLVSVAAQSQRYPAVIAIKVSRAMFNLGLGLRNVAEASPQEMPQGDLLENVTSITDNELGPMVTSIDRDGVYPENVMRALGGSGAFGVHLPGVATGEPDLEAAIRAMSKVSEHCLSTSFCTWCQDALGWYIYTSENTSLHGRVGQKVATGQLLGGTGLSNPMKTLFGIEKMRLKAKRVAGGYTVRGGLPWVSNLGPDHIFGGMFELEDDPTHRIMAIVDCAGPGVKLTVNDNFVALEGTRTYTIGMRDAFIPDEMILADPINAYIPKIRAGFILLQSGMAFGLIRNCISLMTQVRGSLGHVNKHLERQPEDFEESLAAMEAEVFELCKTPFDPDPVYFRRVVEARLQAGEEAVQAAHYAMLHQGARGYVSHGAAQRRLREAYFVAIVTPATKQLRKMLADMSH
ncbi:MAG: acyl-CoA dehydrogenase family protein [Pseudomonadota bacterium]